MKWCLLALLSLTACTVWAQLPSDWRKSNLRAQAVAATVDQHIFKLTDAMGECFVKDKSPSGVGECEQKIQIRNRNWVYIMWPDLTNTTWGLMTQHTLVGHNGSFYDRTAKATKQIPKNQPLIFQAVKDSYVASWMSGFPILMFRPYVTGTGGFSALVAGLAKGNSGFAIKMEERLLRAGTQQSHQSRLVAERPPAVAKKLGLARIEIVFDEKIHLPLQVHVTYEYAKGKVRDTVWTTRWHGPVRFEDKFFNP